jgi:hypothetical protein
MLGHATTEQASATEIAPRARPQLVFNVRLSAIAQGHAQAMADQHFFDHRDPAGRTVGNRASEGGYRWRVVGEESCGRPHVRGGCGTRLAAVAHPLPQPDRRTVHRIWYRRSAQRRSQDEYGVYWVLVLGKPQPTEPVSR